MAISDTARIAPGAVLGTGVSIGEFTIIGAGVTLGDDCVIASHCHIGYDSPLAGGRPLVIGAHAQIRSHSVFYLGSAFGPGLSTGHHVTAREGITAGAGLQLGSYADLQGDTRIGDHVRTHSNVFVAKECTLGDFVWLFPHVVLANDRQPPSVGPHLGPTIEAYAVIAAASTVMPGVRVGRHAVIGAHSLVREDVDDFTLVVGAPARALGSTADMRLDGAPEEAAYPWPRRFQRGYPDEVVARWRAEWGSRPESGQASGGQPREG